MPQTAGSMEAKKEPNTEEAEVRESSDSHTCLAARWGQFQWGF